MGRFSAKSLLAMVYEDFPVVIMGYDLLRPLAQENDLILIDNARK